eukprot:10816186-Karenia_brevis.AAC.1
MTTMITAIADANFASETIIEVDDTESPTLIMEPTMACWGSLAVTRRVTQDETYCLQGKVHMTRDEVHHLRIGVYVTQGGAHLPQ